MNKRTNMQIGFQNIHNTQKFRREEKIVLLYKQRHTFFYSSVSPMQQVS
jgi:hypothetical protein